MTLKITPEMQPAIDAHNEVVARCKSWHEQFGYRRKLFKTKEEHERCNEEYRRMRCASMGINPDQEEV